MGQFLGFFVKQKFSVMPVQVFSTPNHKSQSSAKSLKLSHSNVSQENILSARYRLRAHNYVPPRNRIREFRRNEAQNVVTRVTPSELYLIKVV